MIAPIPSQCCGCSACAQACPKHCIEMHPDSEGFLMPVVDHTICIHCGKCDAVCPIIHASTEDSPQHTCAYAAINLCESTRNASSSGGIFTALAKHTLKQGGVVVGAAFTEGFTSVSHLVIKDEASLYKLQGSKYIQSDLSGIYTDVKSWLQQGVPVFFTGTPCQVDGLLSYLEKPYKNLLCADLICHGAPSPKVWKAYHAFRTKQYGQIPCDISFRKKSQGWKNFCLSFSFPSGQFYESSYHFDPFMQLFLKDICLRPSCYACKFKKIHRRSDLTLADFWGIEHVLPEIDDDKGTSLLLVHTEKGAHILQAISSTISLWPVDTEKALAYNPAAVKSVTMHPMRQFLFSHLDTLSFDKLANKCTAKKKTPNSIIRKVLRKVKQLF